MSPNALIGSTRRARRWRIAAVAAFVCQCSILLAGAGTATASTAPVDRWSETGLSQVPLQYWQGITSSPQGDLFFAGVYSGLYRTNSLLVETARVEHAIPWAITKATGYNHIGDISWDGAEGGRILLPLACAHPQAGQDPNSCHRAAIGVADAATLQLRYYVQLDPADIDTIAWAEASPDGSLIWTATKQGLIAYATSDVVPANAAATGAVIRPVRRLVGAKPPIGTTGAAFLGDRLILAGKSPKDGSQQIWAVDLATGAKRMEVRRQLSGESEGIDVASVLGGDLHWEIFPHTQAGAAPTYGAGHGVVLHFRPRTDLSSACSFISNGGAGNDLLMGTTDGDLDGGRAGNDRLYGLAGDDCLLGGPGRDLISGGDGADRIFGGDGRDTLAGGAGRDRVFGGNGSDRMTGGIDADRLFGGESADAISGGRGNDKLVGAGGNDRMNGGPGRDLLLGGAGADRIEGGRGTDLVAGGDGNDRLSGGGGRDKIIGGSGNDVIDSRDGARDLVYCGDGTDVIRADRADRQFGCERQR